MNHKWNKDNTCLNCGIVREKRSWRLLMAVVGNKDYYKYGKSWYYGIRDKTLDYLIKGIGFKRPDCKPNQQP